MVVLRASVQLALEGHGALNTGSAQALAGGKVVYVKADAAAAFLV